MLLVVLFHCNYLSLGWDDFDTHTLTGVTRVFCEQACAVCVNVFVLISGWFGIKATLKGALSLLFQVAFFSALICGAYVIYKGSISSLSISESISSLLGYCYWFVPCYLALYAVSPVLNAFVNQPDSKRQLQWVIAALFVVEFFYGFLSSTNIGRYHCGHSTISFILIYLLARYCRLYPNRFTNVSFLQGIGLYLLFTILPSLLTIYRGYAGNMLNYDSPFVMLASLYLLLAFSKLQFQSHFINWIACSVFSIYLIHQHVLIVPFFKSTLNALWQTRTGLEYILICAFLCVGLLVVGTLLDKVRIFLWSMIVNFRAKILYH